MQWLVILLHLLYISLAPLFQLYDRITTDLSSYEKYSGTIASAFGATAGIFAVFFFGEVPRVRKDILMNIPVIGGYWERSIPPEDNVSTSDIRCLLAHPMIII